MAYVRRRGRIYYYRYVDADGIKRDVKGCADKRETERMAAAAEAEAAKIRAGLVDPRALETVSRETGVPIYAKIYSDELGVPGEGSGTFLGMLEWNLHAIYNGLTGR